MLTVQLLSGSTIQRSELVGCVLSKPKRSELACLRPSECPRNFRGIKTTQAWNCLSRQSGANLKERAFISPFSKMTCCSHADHPRDNSLGITKACRQNMQKPRKPSYQKNPKRLLCTSLKPFSLKLMRICNRCS